jgi:hypothetical protein
MLTFLPQSHPQSYLPMLFRLWESVNSYLFDERMLQFLAQLSEMHLDPTISDPKRIDEISDDARSENEGRPNWAKNDLSSTGLWAGIYKDVGIFAEYDWHFIMCKCLASMGWCFPKFYSTNFSPEPIFRNPTCRLGIPYHGPVCRPSSRFRDRSPSEADLANWWVCFSSCV